MKEQARKTLVVVTLPILMLLLASLACNEPGYTPRPEDPPTATPYLLNDENLKIEQQFRKNLVNEDGSPELIFNFSAENMMDLPVYRASLSNPFIVSKTGPGPWDIEHIGSRTDDLLKLGGDQPGTVIQESTFVGSYFPKDGTLQGQLTHEYIAHQEATEDKLESQATSKLACYMSLNRVAGTNTLQGTCEGSLSYEYIVPGYPDYNQKSEKAVTLMVSTELPEELLDQP